MKKVVLLWFIFAAALASADTINQTFGYMPVTTQGTWGFNNGNPPIALSLLGGNTATLQLGAVVFNVGDVVSNPSSWSNVYPVTHPCGFGTCFVGYQVYGGDSNTVAGNILAGQLVPCASGHGECRVTSGTFAFNWAGNYSSGPQFNSRSDYLNSGSVNIIETAAVPEPGTLGMMGTGLLGLAFYVKRTITASLISAA